MTFHLQQSVAVITGAAHGIGAALAFELAKRGCNLALVDLDAAKLALTANAARMHEVRVTEHVLDIADASAIAALPEQVLAGHGRVNLLINNAGVALMGHFEQVSLEEFEWLFNINFWGVVRTTKAFLPFLRQETQAHVVNLSSVFGLISPTGQAAYCASKFAVRGFSDALRHELANTGITVSSVHPGGIKTRIAHHARRAAAFNEDDAQQLAERFFNEVRTTPEQAAQCIVKGIEQRASRILIGPAARFIDWLSRLFPVGYWRILRRILDVKAPASVQEAATLEGKNS